MNTILAELRSSEERFRSLVEETTDWVWESDAEHRFTWISPSADRIIGTPSVDALGKTRQELVDSDYEIDQSLWKAYYDDIAHFRAFRDFRYWVNVKNGEPKWISISGAPRFDDNGMFVGYRGSGTDVTDEARTQMRLKMLSTVVDQSPISVVVTNPDGIIEYVNAHYTIANGYSREEVIGQTPKLHSSSLTPSSVHSAMWECIKSGQRWMGEVRNRCKNGDLRWVSLIISPVRDLNGHTKHYVAIMEDVTERHELQDKLFTTNAELQQFAYVASHDLRQPLRMVTSYLGLIEKNLGAAMTDQLKSYFAFASNGAKRMDHLIVDLLEYSRTGRSPEFAPISLGESVADALQNLAISIQNAHAEIIIAKDLPTIDGNAVDLVRLFQNLIGNSLKYHDPARIPKIEVDWREDGPHCVVWVKDNGIGIAPEDRDRAFMIFQRLVPKDSYEGTGIGLSVCKKIVEYHGGTIWIESELGQGSMFLMKLPRHHNSSASDGNAVLIADGREK